LAQTRNILTESSPRKYWKYQLIGWSLAALYWAYNFYFIQAYSVFHTITNFIFDVIIGISILYKS